MNCLDMVVSLSNQKCRFFRPEQLQDPYIVDLRPRGGGGVSELTDRQGCAILALKVVLKNIIFA